MVPSILLLASLVTLVVANPLNRRAMQLHESRTAIPAGFTKSGTPSPDTVVKFRVALTQTDPDGLTDALYDVSTPSSANYGNHLTKEEVEKFVAPKPETVTAVNEWLSEHGITAQPISPTGDWISFTATISQVNQMLDAEFSTFTHSVTGDQTVRTLAYSIPTDLKDHVLLVHPTISFPSVFAPRPVFSGPIKVNNPAVNLTGDAVPASCASVITPTCIQALYGIPTTRATQSSNTLGVSGFIDQFANSADLRTFLANLRTDISSSTTFTLQTLDGGSNPQGRSQAGIEADLDVQYTIGIATGVPTFFISVGDNFHDGDLEGFLDIVNFLNGESNPPHVLTTSYGANEDDLSSALSIQLCNAYQQLGARGVSILFASGDGGVSGGQSQPCTTFVPAFPSGCPFLTSVGATTGVPETSASFSSGGFSNVFNRPAYQAASVSSYLTTLGSTNAGKFNTSGRAFPDVSAMGDNVEIVWQQQAGLVAGTSCSSPIFASVVALLNDRLVAAGKPVLGFLNPFLYTTGASAFNDIITGSNPGCNTNGFPAVAGWDPVTGLGTPNFPKLLTAVGL